MTGRGLGAAALLLLLGTGLLQACAGVPTVCGTAAALDPVASLRCEAARGSKQAQLELGIRYEEGLGVERDPRRAASLYRAAAAPSDGTIYVYSPPVGGEKSGRVIPLNAGPQQPGLVEAQYRLALLHLNGAGVSRSLGRARRLLEQASRAGHREAAVLLSRLR